MAENMIDRVKRLIGGGANAFVTSLENSAPTVVMQEAVNEVDRAYEEIKVDLGRLVAKGHLVRKELGAKNNRHEELSSQIAVALDEGKENLAEAGIAKQIDIEIQIPILEVTISEIDAEQQTLKGYMNALAAKKREMEEDLENFKQYQKDSDKTSVPGSDGNASADRGTVRSVKNASETFNRVLKDAAEVDLLRGDEQSSDFAELAELSRQKEIKNRLDGIKLKMKNTG